MGILNRTYHRFVNIDPRATEITSVLCLLVWSIIVYIGSWSNNAAYDSMREIAPYHVWASIVAFVGIAQAVCLMFGNYLHRSMSAFTACLIFSVIAGFTAQEAWQIPTPYIYGVIALANGWACAQLTR